MPDDIFKQRILILEDEPIICRVLSRALKAYGFTVDTAENGSIAKEKIVTGGPYDLFIFDIKTPVINGIQLYEYLKKEHPEYTEKVIFMTGDTLSAATGAFLENVKRPYLSKPFTPDQMLDVIKQTTAEPATA